MTLRVAFVPGVTITKWSRIWAERHPSKPLEFLPVSEREQLAALKEDLADVCFVRLPVEREGLSVIRLYGEVPVAVLEKDHPLSDAAGLELSELAGETILSIPETADSPAGSGVDPAKEAIELVAAGAGVLVLPHSVARLYNRKDVRAVPVTDADETEIALVWRAEETTEDIDDWVGIVRGRTAASSRGRQPVAAEAETGKKKQPKEGSAKKGAASSTGARRPARALGRFSVARKPRRKGR